MQSGRRLFQHLAAGLVATLMLTSVAQAVEPQPLGGEITPVSFQFRFNPEELDAPGGAQRVYRNLVQRAARACTDFGDPAASLRRTDSDCAAKLVERVVRQIGSATLLAQWQRDQPLSPVTAVAQSLR